MKFFQILVLAAASASAFSLDARHHQGRGKKGGAKKNGANAASNNTARALESIQKAVDHVAFDVVNLVSRHHAGKSKASKANKNNGNAASNNTARAIDISVEQSKRTIPVPLDIATRDLGTRHHNSLKKSSKASKNKGNGASNNATARAVAPESESQVARSAPVTLDLETRDFNGEVQPRHHQGGGKKKGNKAAKASNAAASNSTARAVDIEGKAPVDLIGRSFVA